MMTGTYPAKTTNRGQITELLPLIRCVQVEMTLNVQKRK